MLNIVMKGGIGFTIIDNLNWNETI